MGVTRPSSAARIRLIQWTSSHYREAERLQTHAQELLATGVYDAEESLQRATAALVDAQVGAMLAAANVLGLSANLI